MNWGQGSCLIYLYIPRTINKGVNAQFPCPGKEKSTHTWGKIPLQRPLQAPQRWSEFTTSFTSFQSLSYFPHSFTVSVKPSLVNHLHTILKVSYEDQQLWHQPIGQKKQSTGSKADNRQINDCHVVWEKDPLFPLKLAWVESLQKTLHC